eukprot:1883790-Pyramimonas_sp.AAC.1
MPLADAEELYTHVLTWSSERSIVTPTKGLHSLSWTASGSITRTQSSHILTVLIIMQQQNRGR